MKISIVLVESHYRSRSWFLALKDIGLTHIISVMPEEYKNFLKAGFPDKNICNLYFSQKQIDNNFLLEKLEYYENFLGINFNNVVNTDRTLRKKSQYYINQYLYYLVKKLEEFFKNAKPKIIFIEPTWTHEIIICYFAKKYNVLIAAPVKDKLIPDRFLVFTDYGHKNILTNVQNNKYKFLTETAISIVNKNKKVQYFEKFNKRNKIDFSKTPKLIRLLKLSLFNLRNPNIQGSFFQDIFIKLRAIFRAKFQLLIYDFKMLNEIKQKYILITLHVQPEASIDVVGSKYSNQIEFVRHVSISSPVGSTILVKEHPHALGNRENRFYRDLLRIPNVALLHPNENSRKSISKSELVISNTGTISLEAAILKKKAVTSTPMFFSNIMAKSEFNCFEDKISDLLAKSYIITDNTLSNKLNKIYKYSFEGNCGDFQTDPNVLKKENITKLKNSFASIIKSVNQGK